MHNLESDFENETYKILWDFEMQMGHLVQARKPNVVLIKKKKRTCHLVDFAVPEDHKLKVKEGKNMDEYLDLAKK